MAKTQYSFKKGLSKGLKRFILMGVPAVGVMAVGLIPNDIANMTVAGVVGYLVTLLENFIKVKLEK